jgi:hypothetical protein
MGLLLAIMAIGLPFFSVVSLMVRAFYAHQGHEDARAGGDGGLRDQHRGISLILIRFLG